MRVIRLYFRLLGAHLRSMLEYDADFWILMAGTAVLQAVNIAFISIILTKIPFIDGWSFWAIVAKFAMAAIAEGVGSLFFGGMWNLGLLINRGELDYMMVRPLPVALQISSSSIGINGVSNIVTGSLMVGFAVTNLDIVWTPWRVGFCLVLVASTVVIKVAINLATNSASFWLRSPSPLFALAVHQAGELARFPLSIYAVPLQGLLVYILPFAFVSFFPISFLVGHDPAWPGLLTPLVAIYCALVAWWVFRAGLRRYESAT